MAVKRPPPQRWQIGHEEDPLFVLDTDQNNNCEDKENEEPLRKKYKVLLPFSNYA